MIIISNTIIHYTKYSEVSSILILRSILKTAIIPITVCDYAVFTVNFDNGQKIEYSNNNALFKGADFKLIDQAFNILNKKNIINTI